jgi:hypothetical protein
MDRASNSDRRVGSEPASRNRIDYASVISNYLTDWFRGGPNENRSASLTIVKETKDGYYKRVDYNGPPEGLSMLKDFMRNTTQLKETIIKENDEDSANTLLAIECFCQALRSEMLM